MSKDGGETVSKDEQSDDDSDVQSICDELPFSHDLDITRQPSSFEPPLAEESKMVSMHIAYESMRKTPADLTTLKKDKAQKPIIVNKTKQSKSFNNKTSTNQWNDLRNRKTTKPAEKSMRIAELRESSEVSKIYQEHIYSDVYQVQRNGTSCDLQRGHIQRANSPSVKNFHASFLKFGLWPELSY